MKDHRPPWIARPHQQATEASNTYPGHEERVLRHSLRVAEVYAADPSLSDAAGAIPWRGWVTIASNLRRRFAKQSGPVRDSGRNGVG